MKNGQTVSSIPHDTFLKVTVPPNVQTLEGRMNLTLSWIKMTAPLYEKLKTIRLVQKQIHLDILHNHEKLQIRSQPEHRYKDL